MQTVTHAVVIVCWLTFMVFWAVTRGAVKKTQEAASVRETLLTSISIWTGLALLIGGREMSPSLNPVLWQETPAVDAVVIVLSLLGIATLLWSRVTLGQNWSDKVEFKENHELVQTGPYALVRHPIYTGVGLLLLGLFILIGRALGIAGFAFSFGAFYVRSLKEEKLLLRHFGDRYRVYMTKTKAVIPFIF